MSDKLIAELEIRSELGDKGGFVGKSVAELEEENVIDTLTGLLNRKGWYEKISEYQKHALRTGEALSFVSMDLDNLKVINDTQGHEAGDVLIQKFADVIKKVGRSTDILARLGGDEFAACLSATSINNAEIFKQRILREAGDIKLSIGIGSDYAQADTEMYKMKVIHKNV